MKLSRLFDKLFMFLGFFAAGISAALSFMEDKPFIWQLGCMAWIVVAFLKQLTIESYEEEE